MVSKDFKPTSGITYEIAVLKGELFSDSDRITKTIRKETKDLYLAWYGCYKSLPKEHRYTLGARIDNLLSELIESISGASFLVRQEKLPYIKPAIRKADSIKVFLLLLWKTRSLDNNRYIALSTKINGIGRMLGGWSGQIIKQNSSIKR